MEQGKQLRLIADAVRAACNRGSEPVAGKKRRTKASLGVKKSSRGEPLRYTLERDDGQVSASDVLAEFKFECDSRLTADESLRRGAP